MRYIVLSMSLLFASMPSIAADQAWLQSMQQCKNIKENDVRLACFDKFVDSLPALNSTSTKPSTSPATTLSAPIVADDFGKSKPLPAEELDEITSTAKSIRRDSRNKLVVTLTNGQVWQQTDAAALNLKLNSTVIIKRGAMGSFRLGNPESNRRIRVKRID